MDADSPCAIAIRLADEGVPVAAIARATHIPSTRLYETLTLARMEGRLLDLPRDDWPPGCPRDQRALQLSRMVTQNPEAVHLAIQRVFALTPTEATILMTLLSSPDVPKERIDMAHRTIMCILPHPPSPGAVRDRDRHHLGLRLQIIRS